MRTALGVVLILATVTGCRDASEPPAPAGTPSVAAPAPSAQTPPATAEATPGGEPVTAENFVRAETDVYFGKILKDAGAVGKFHHNRDVTPIEHQPVVRQNRDTLYTSAVFDLDAGPVTVTLPDAGGRFLSMQVIDQDEYTPKVVYTAGPHTLTRKDIGTRYVVTAIRILVDPNSPEDLAKVRALQDAIKAEQPGGPGSFDVPKWDTASQKKVRDALLTLASTLPDSRKAFGTKAEVDPVRRLVMAASAWGGNPDKDALYLNVVPEKNDGTTVHRLTVKDVPVDGFWSISLYNGDGFFQKNEHNAYSINNVTAKKADDGSVTVQFGGCDGKIPNCLPIMKGWNYLVRLYRPRPEVLSGKWTFPAPQPVAAAGS